MLQGSLYETLTRKINRPCNFSYLTCVDIILSGGPSTFFFYFKVRAPRKLFVYNRAPLFLPHHLFCFRTNFLLSNIFLCYPSCAFFFLRLEHLVNYLCTIVRLYFCTIICFVFVQISGFQIFFCVTHRVHFFLPHPVLLLLF